MDDSTSHPMAFLYGFCESASPDPCGRQDGWQNKCQSAFEIPEVIEPPPRDSLGFDRQGHCLVKDTGKMFSKSLQCAHRSSLKTTESLLMNSLPSSSVCTGMYRTFGLCCLMMLS